MDEKDSNTARRRETLAWQIQQGTRRGRIKKKDGSNKWASYGRYTLNLRSNVSRHHRDQVEKRRKKKFPELGTCMAFKAKFDDLKMTFSML